MKKLLLRIFVCSYIGHNEQPTGLKWQSLRNWGPGRDAPTIVTLWACTRCGRPGVESWQWEADAP